MSAAIEAVVFDIGGVLPEWNPRYLYRKLFADRTDMERSSKRSAHPSGTQLTIAASI